VISVFGFYMYDTKVTNLLSLANTDIIAQDYYHSYGCTWLPTLI